MGCPVCSTKQLVEIDITLGESRVTMHSCSRCDTRWWDRNGRRVNVDGVLQLASRR